MKLLQCALVMVLGPVITVPAFAAVTVSTPANNAEVTSPFSLQATAGACSSQSVSAMGYSLDNSANTTIINAATVNAMVTASVGAHVLHVKSWGNRGSSCTSDVQLNVVPAPTIPANVTVASNLQTLSSWQEMRDSTMAGGSSGSTTLVSSPSLSGNAREFTMSFSDAGGELFHASFGADTAATHFVYEAHLYLTSASDVANVEMDMNQVIANGQTVIYGFQCDGYYGTWDYTVNKGTPTKPVDTWLHSNVACNPKDWSRNTWHDIQIAYSRDANGNVTYESVTFDGVQSELTNATGNSAFALGWSPTLLTNFQLDGSGSTGSATAYLDDLTIYRW